MPSPESAALREHYASITAVLGAHPDLDLGLVRALIEGLHVRTAEPTGVTYAEADAGGRPALWALPPGAATDCAVLYLHGGGYVMQSVYSHRKLAGHLALAAGAPVLLPDYRQAPEHVFPAQLDDAVAAFRWLAEQGYDPARIAIAGDSAGAALSVTTAVRLRDEDGTRPAALLGFSPWFDFECVGAGLETNNADDALLQRPLVEQMSALFLGPDGSPKDPTANPLHADLTGLPPVHLTAGSYESVLDNSEMFAERARSAGVDVTVEVSPEQQHVYVLMAGRAPEADATIEASGRWLREQLGAGDR